MNGFMNQPSMKVKGATTDKFEEPTVKGYGE